MHKEAYKCYPYPIYSTVLIEYDIQWFASQALDNYRVLEIGPNIAFLSAIDMHALVVIQALD